MWSQSADPKCTTCSDIRSWLGMPRIPSCIKSFMSMETNSISKLSQLPENYTTHSHWLNNRVQKTSWPNRLLTRLKDSAHLWLLYPWRRPLRHWSKTFKRAVGRQPSVGVVVVRWTNAQPLAEPMSPHHKRPLFMNLTCSIFIMALFDHPQSLCSEHGKHRCGGGWTVNQRPAWLLNVAWSIGCLNRILIRSPSWRLCMNAACLASHRPKKLLWSVNDCSAVPTWRRLSVICQQRSSE